MLRFLAPVLILTALLLTACASPPHDPNVRTVESATLVAALPGIIEEAIEANKAQGIEPPPGYGAPDFTDSVVDSIREQYRDAPVVTKWLENQFASGRFSDVENTERLRSLLRQAEEQNMRLNTVAAYLADRFRAGKLHGLRLELATRLAASQLNAAMLGQLQSAL